MEQLKYVEQDSQMGAKFGGISMESDLEINDSLWRWMRLKEKDSWSWRCLDFLQNLILKCYYSIYFIFYAKE